MARRQGYQPSDTLVGLIKPFWVEAVEKAESQIPKEIRNLSRKQREALHFSVPGCDNRTIRQKISENVRGMLTSLSRRYAHEHQEEVQIINNGKFTKECQSLLSFYLGSKSISSRFYRDLASDIVSWADNRAIDDPAGFSYELRGQDLYITMKKANQPLPPFDFSKVRWEKVRAERSKHR